MSYIMCGRTGQMLLVMLLLQHLSLLLGGVFQVLHSKCFNIFAPLRVSSGTCLHTTFRTSEKCSSLRGEWSSSEVKGTSVWQQNVHILLSLEISYTPGEVAVYVYVEYAPNMRSADVEWTQCILPEDITVCRRISSFRSSHCASAKPLFWWRLCWSQMAIAVFKHR